MRRIPLTVMTSLLCTCGGSGASTAVHNATRSEANASAEAQQAARLVRLAAVTATHLGRSVVVNGTLAAQARVVVSAKVPGRLAAIGVDLGSPIREGDAIAQLEPTDYQLRVEGAASALAQVRALLGLPLEGTSDAVDIERTNAVLQARATLKETEARAGRARRLVEQKLIAPAEFEPAEGAFVRAASALAAARDDVRNREALLRQRRFELRLAKQQLADATIRAPLTGFVQERLATPGEYLNVGTPIATVVSTDPLRLRVQIPERDASQVEVGQSAAVFALDAVRPVPARVARIAPGLDEQSRTLAVEIEVPNQGVLKPGAFARAEIAIADLAAAKVVPESAVVQFAGIEKVITIKDGRAVEQPIKTGRRSSPWIEVLSGVELGDRVVVEPGNLQQGEPVRSSDRS